MKLSYKAWDAAGKSVVDVIDAPNVADARENLRRRGLFVEQINESAAGGNGRAKMAHDHGDDDAAPTGGWRRKRSRGKRLKALSAFCRQMYIMIKTGTPIVQALEAVERQTRDAVMKQAIRDVRIRVEEGESLSEAMAGRPEYFDPASRSLIAAGQGRALARWWRAQERAAADRDEPPLARVAASKALLDQLAAARRARRLHRGLEGAATVLGSEEAGLRLAAATRSGDAGVRISRLLLVSADGSARFYRQVVALRQQYASRLEALMLDCDDLRLGEAIYGQGRRARAVLSSHKEVVAELLSTIEAGLSATASADAASLDGPGGIEDGSSRSD